MSNQDTVIQFQNKEQFSDLLTDLARQGAVKMLASAIEAEVDDFLEAHQSQSRDGRKRLVRNGYLPERNIQSGIGDLAVKVPRVRDRDAGLKYQSNIVPPYLRRSRSIEALLPLLYLRGISTGDFQETLAPLVGENAKNLSPNVISRLKATWLDEYQQWIKRDLSKKEYVYIWADGIYLKARMEDERSCVLVIIGVDKYGKKELLALEDGYRESKISWSNLICDVQNRGLKSFPKVGVGDGALGFWAALSELCPETRHQRCWVHKTSVSRARCKSAHPALPSCLDVRDK